MWEGTACGKHALDILASGMELVSGSPKPIVPKVGVVGKRREALDLSSQSEFLGK